MNKNILPYNLTEQLVANPTIKQQLESIIWFGSIRNNQDVHKASDFDIQIIFNTPSYNLSLAINDILKNYPKVDLSIMYLQDIYDSNKKIIFHDGTKSFFFMYVLSAGEVIYGRNIYGDIIRSLTLEDSKPSLLVTIREYLSRLRVMAAQSPGDKLKFKKYSLKLFKDVLLYKGLIPLENITHITNVTAREKITTLHTFSDTSLNALDEITNYNNAYSQAQLATLLQDYEQIVNEICNE